ncbi:Abi family protein [[Clostridium] innocuum]|nr:Abi family protein [[Clostridium] innocuum]
MNKTYKTIDEQIEYLKDSKKIIVKAKHKKILEDRNYSSLINPYKEFFSFGRDEQGNHIYNTEIDFEEILKIIKTDEEFSRIMYSFIGTFEKKFKNVLFSEICSKYIGCEDEDKNCIKYVDEIDKFLKTNDDKDLPRFCSNYRYSLSKKEGYVLDEFRNDKRKSVLQYIKEIGTGKRDDGSEMDRSNRLITHYLKTQTIAPLWVIPNALTLGELSVLFSMLDSNSQKIIISKFYEIAEYKKIDIKKIVSFSGQIEIIRRIRNVVNHYEPIFPMLSFEMKHMKKIQSSQMVVVFELLERTYTSSLLSNLNFDDANIEENQYNSKNLRILNLMKDMINKCK